MMPRRRCQGLLVLAGALLTLWSGQLPAQPSTPGARPGGPRTVVPADLYVDDDNAGPQDGSALRPFRTVQQAIDAAKGNAVIAVAGGTYPQNVRVQDKAVRLYGGYVGGTKAGYASGKAGNFAVRDPAANPSHLKGDGKDSVVSLQESGASIVDGFLVTGGGRSALAAPSWLGGGFYVYGGSPTISNNVIEKNQTCPPVKQDQENLGGGIYFTGPSISILDNVIRNNVSGRGAGIAVDGRKVVIRGNIVQGNVGVSDHGGGLHIFSENAEIAHNRVVGNEIGRALGYGWGGGIIVFNTGGKYKLSHNVFTGNFAPSVGSAVFVDDGAVASLDHDLIYANACNPAGDGAVAPVYVDGDEKVGSTLDVNHVTIADHTCKPAVPGTAIAVTDRSKLTVKNSILWNNGGDDVKVDATSRATVTYTLSQTAIRGTGNISKDPLFVNPAGHDYRLRSNSPAINAAETTPNGGRANLGANGDTAQAGPVETPSKAYLLRGTAGELPSEAGDDGTKMTKVTSQEFGGTAVQIELIDTFGQKRATVEDWTPYHTLRLDIVSKGAKDLQVEFNLFHSGTQAFATRVVAPFVLKPGKNEVRIAVKDLKNTNGSPAKLAEVRRWYVASQTRATLLVGDIYLEGKASVAAAGAIKIDAARLARIKSARMPTFAKPVLYNTPEADAIMSAAEIFPADNPWNTLVDDWPVHPNSKAMVASVGADKPLRYNRDMAFVIVPPGQKKVDVKLVQYPAESDPGPYPVADDTPIEGWPASFQQNPKLKTLTLDDVQRGKPSLDEDRHGIVFDPAARKLYEFYRLTKTDKGWHADQASVFDLSSNKLRPDGWTSSDAAGLPILPAIVRYDEMKRGVIDHALRFTVRRSRRAYVYPATHFASRLTDENLPRMGERFRLRKDFDTSKFSPEVRVILEALKRFGMLMADNGMDWGLSVSADHRLPAFDDELRRVKGSDFEVVTPPPGYSAP
ncbi:MAG: right-handed parallel beta-helix repeat-containing protein [Gemmataceae bacterium]